MGDRITCASYTHARRHPMVLGRIAGWTPPCQLSITQICVLFTSVAVMARTWGAWAPMLPDTVALLVAAGVPIGLTWSVRRVRVEGRSLPRTLVGWLSLWSSPTCGVVRGRPCRDQRPASWAPVRVLLAPGEQLIDTSATGDPSEAGSHGSSGTVTGVGGGRLSKPVGVGAGATTGGVS